MPRVSQFDRARIIALAQACVSQGAIAALVGHTRKSVRRWIKAYQLEARLEDASHARRPRSTTEQQDMLIVAAIDNSEKASMCWSQMPCSLPQTSPQPGTSATPS
ncbi:hypothetical protein HPB47_015718 [Ixodes persulcatus]|uniref:Uncharacterized protein n=1 Tax=Ixodes persulcatus TaxID=34615 RepID=A0AC60R0D7_IXOPE|nr:hypothetical protein HPB47_015718 [Ixodes persulcatus]